MGRAPPVRMVFKGKDMESLTLLMLGVLFAVLGFIWAVFCCIHALLHKKDSQSALAWVACILLLPFVGSMAYSLFGISRADSLAGRLLDEAARRQDSSDRMLDRKLDMENDDNLPREWQALAVGRSLTGRSMLRGNRLELLKNGEEAYPAMLEAIRQAKHMVCLSTYIFKGDSTGRAFAEALGDAAERGVDVRLIVDGVGGMIYSLHKPWKKLHERGVKMQMFLPPRLWPPMFAVNLRTHRKVLSCDGEVAFTGGMNIGDHHLVHLPRPGRVQDIHFRCTGPVAMRLQEAFLMDWAFVTKLPTPPSLMVPEEKGTSHCRLVFDGLGRSREDIHELVCGVISSAKHRVTIFTPYFIPPRELSGALVAAVERGVRVDLVLPEKNNLFYVHHASRRFQGRLVEKGVRIWYQPPPFAHTKLLLVDDWYALFGSANLDPRSLFLNFELNVEAADPVFQKELSRYADEVIGRSRRMLRADYESCTLPARLFDALCWLFSPYI